MRLMIVQELKALRGFRRAPNIFDISANNIDSVGWFCTSPCDVPIAAEISSSCSWYRDAVPSEDPSSQSTCLSLRIESLRLGDSVALALQKWMGDGLPVHRGHVFHMINRLRKLKSAKRALEVMEWVIRERPYRPKELDYSYLLEFTMKLHGISHGAALFSRIPSEFRKELLYNNLVLGCLEKGSLRLSLAYMRKMRELGHTISYLIFNRLIILHSSPSRRKSIPKILAQMRADGVARHVSTYNILLKIQAYKHDIEGLIEVFNDMKQITVEPNEISYCIIATAYAVAGLNTACGTYVAAIEKSMAGLNWSTLEILLTLYGYLGKQKELERTWRKIQNLPHVRTKSFVLAIEAFGRVGNLGRAEEIYLEMVSEKGLKSTEQFNCLIGIYCKNGLITKATGIYRVMENNACQPNAITFRHLALGCLKACLVKEANKTLELGQRFMATAFVRRSIPWLETTLCMMDAFADNGDLQNVEILFEDLRKANYSKYTFVYNSLIKAYVKAKVYEPNLLRRMILGGSRPDSVTYSLLKLIELFRSC